MNIKLSLEERRKRSEKYYAYSEYIAVLKELLALVDDLEYKNKLKLKIKELKLKQKQYYDKPLFEKVLYSFKTKIKEKKLNV